MVQESIQTELFVTLVQRYEQDPREFVRLPQQTVDSSVARIAVAELRNEGYVEEQVRGSGSAYPARISGVPESAAPGSLEKSLPQGLARLIH